MSEPKTIPRSKTEAGGDLIVNILGTKQCKFFTVPQEIVRSGLLRELSGSALKLYVFLLDHCQRYSCVAVELSNLSIGDFSGLHANTIAGAREALERAGLISCFACDQCGGIIRYRLLNPEKRTGLITSRWLTMPSGEDRMRHYTPTGRSARKSRATKKALREKRPATNQPVEIPWNELGKGQVQEIGQ